MLINIEGIDGSGKSTIAKMLCKYLNENKLKFGDELTPWILEREPNFDSQTADALNFVKGNSWQREFYFMKDRMQHQEKLRTNDVVLDRYIWTGLAYASVFSPEVLDMCVSFYSLSSEFIKPDIIFYMDVNPNDAIKINESRKGTPEYSEKLKLQNLISLKEAFEDTKKFIREWEIPFLIVESKFGQLDESLDTIIKFLNGYMT